MGKATNFREWREARGITRYRVRMDTGLSDPELQRIEEGDTDPRCSTCLVLRDYAARRGGGLTLEAIGGPKAAARVEELREAVRAAAPGDK